MSTIKIRTLVRCLINILCIELSLYSNVKIEELLIIALWRDTDHSNYLRVDGLREDAAARRDVVHNLVQGRPLDLLPLEVGHGVHEVEADAALPQLPDEQLLLLVAGHICTQKYLLLFIKNIRCDMIAASSVHQCF